MLLEQSSMHLRRHADPKPNRETSSGKTDNLMLDIQILQKNTTALYVYQLAIPKQASTSSKKNGS
jgi:hypothetical protein